MRTAIFALCGLQLLALALAGADVATMSSDPAGRGMAQGMVTLAGLVMAVFVVPAMILAITRQGLKIGLGLALVPPALLVLFALWTN